jgi:histone deacetylase 1/2
MIYTDDGIFCGPTQAAIDEAFALLTQVKGEYPAFKLTDEGDLSDYLGVKVDQLPNGTIKLSQPHLIQQVLDDLGFNERTGTKPTPAASTVRLHRDLHGAPFAESWHYRSVIGKLNFIEKSTRLDLAYSVHQCARFSADPKESHAKAVKRIGKYLLATKEKGLILNPRDHSFDCWVDADFVGNWSRVNADEDPSTAKSRTGYVITYAACPIVWGSKLQTEVALSTTESEYNAISTSLREVIHLMQIVDEVKRLEWIVYSGIPTVHCKLFEDNSGALEMARLPKMRPRTKHLCVRLHHFREYVRAGRISINKIPTEFQLGDIATKPQPEALFVSQRESLMQWEAEGLSKAELVLPARHMRACDIREQAPALCVVSNDSTVRTNVSKQPAKPPIPVYGGS